MTSVKIRGGSRVGQSYWRAINETFPLASLEITRDRLTLKSLFNGRFEFGKDDIESLSLITRMRSSGGLRFHHRKEGVSPYVVFWTLSLPKVQQQLEAFGWVVAREQQNSIR